MAKIQAMEGWKRAPKGHFVVYVGEELRRYFVPTSYLRNPSFQQLLERAAEEYGYPSQKGIILPCDETTFQRGPLHNSLVDAIESHKAMARNSPYSKRIFSHKLLKK
ncbi:unnamed protein product [Ilex paraguariensis]|uniref:Small auxin up regulated protein n=1 Tax=Ilex paraguariensis TaxID=185542 RepID=A0ABC8T860_9AQUA